MRIRLVWLVGLVLCAIQAAAKERVLNVLLTNDDGIAAPGLVALHAALRGAGHRVTVVAPREQQSGSGVRITLGQIGVVAQGEREWAIEGSPADAAAYGIQRIMRDRPPDVVVSGANLGQNLGANVVSSGTVGAAVMAAQLGVPAIAVSVGLDLAEAQATPERFPNTAAAYPRAAAVTVRLLATLARAAGEGPLLPPDTVVNLNYPGKPASAVRGIVLAPLGRHGGFELSYPSDVVDGKTASTIAVDPDGVADAGTDTALFATDHVTVSVLRADWNARRKSTRAVAEALGDLSRLLAPSLP